MSMHQCPACKREYSNPVFISRCPCGGGVYDTQAPPVFVSDVLSAPVAQEPVPTEAAEALRAYNDSAPGVTLPQQSLHAQINSLPASYFTVYGEQVLNELLLIGRDKRARMPVLLVGETGSGKSHLIRAVAQMIGIGYRETNAYPGMDISLWFGMHRPAERDGFIGLDWQNGLLTEAALQGEAFFMEEATRAPQDGVGRLFGPLDNGFRYLSLPEKGELSVPIHDDFWFIATANPATAGYAVQRMDKAFNSRFLHITINQPIADETRILDDLIGQHEHRDKFWRVILDCRNHPESFINTRDIIMAARCIGLGFDPMRAIEIGIADKYGDFRGAIMTAADLHFNGNGNTTQEGVNNA